MQIAIFSFTRQACKLSIQLQNKLKQQYSTCVSYTMEKYATEPNLTAFPISAKDSVASVFHTDHVLIFIGACGIAVRLIAPFIDKKTTDPCVLCIDEKGNYVISLLSGHIGGGNEFAMTVADIIHAIPIISTATDLNHKFAIDVFAKKHHLALSDMKIAKLISARLLDHLPVGVSGYFPDSPLPEGIISNNDNLPYGFTITPFSNYHPFPNTLHLIPKQIVLGIGCKKNTDSTTLRNFVNDTLKAHNIYANSIACITSIDLKKEETAITEYAKSMQVPFVTFSAKQLSQVPGNFTASPFVKSITGVDNVCERATLAYSKADTLYMKKTARDKCTLAISLLNLKTILS